jgi:hypothetical protein
MARASAFISTSSSVAPEAAMIVGHRTEAGSPISRLSESSMISSAKRSALFQSMAMTASKRSSMHATGRVDRRTKAAASPPRICGPTERVIRPYQPQRPAASSKRPAAVSEPAPPLPRMARQMLVRAVSGGVMACLSGSALRVCLFVSRRSAWKSRFGA